MRFLALIIFILLIYPTQQSFFMFKKQRKLPFPSAIASVSEDNLNLYRSVMTGSKQDVNKELINALRYYGLIHLLTPSGIHLSSLGVFIKLLTSFHLAFEFVFIFLCLIGLRFYDGYYSMERVLIFRAISKLIPSLTRHKDGSEYIFIFTILLSLILGHFQKSSLSLIYSMAFWGTIIFYRNNPIKVLFYMNFMLYFMGSFTGEAHSLLSLIINPIFTIIMSSVFPLLVTNIFLSHFSLDFISKIINNFFNIYSTSIIYLHSIDPLPAISLSTLSLGIFIFLFQFKKIKTSFFIICLFAQAPNPKKINFQNKSYTKYNPTGVYYSKKRLYWIYSKNISCKNFDLEFYCKKKALRQKRAW